MDPVEDLSSDEQNERLEIEIQILKSRLRKCLFRNRLQTSQKHVSNVSKQFRKLFFQGASCQKQDLWTFDSWHQWNPEFWSIWGSFEAAGFRVFTSKTVFVGWNSRGLRLSNGCVFRGENTLAELPAKNKRHRSVAISRKTNIHTRWMMFPIAFWRGSGLASIFRFSTSVSTFFRR